MSILSDIAGSVGKRRLHMTLIDPASQSPEKSGIIAREADEAGSDYIMIGGSTSVSPEMVDETVASIKAHCSLRTILFPGSADMISRKADAIFFMTLMNSRNPKFLMGYQVRAARYLKSLGIEILPMGYIIFQPGMTVGRVGEADLVGRDDKETAASYAVAAEMLGLKLVYFESGSGSPTTIPAETIKFARKQINIPLIVGGGIRSEKSAREISIAGADIIVTGTVAEKASAVLEVLKPIINAVRSG
ncbi:MAG: geranylgeranylglyceryl/heptaprenylglyceryl phosphate synthase [Thermoplasmataceae archaeon]|jgi:phosphoglycerol geranylgeranyltransferase